MRARFGLSLLCGLLLCAACAGVVMQPGVPVVSRTAVLETPTAVPLPPGLHAWKKADVEAAGLLNVPCPAWSTAGVPETNSDGSNVAVGWNQLELLFCNTSDAPITVVVTARAEAAGYSYAALTVLGCYLGPSYCTNAGEATSNGPTEIGYQGCAFRTTKPLVQSTIAREFVVYPYVHAWRNVWRLQAWSGSLGAASYCPQNYANSFVRVEGLPPPATPTQTHTPTATPTVTPTRTPTIRPTSTYCAPGRCPENATRTPTATRVFATVTPSATYCPPERCDGGTPIPTPTYCAPENCP